MFNDVWACSSWASIESTGRQKLLYYSAKYIHSPVIVYPYYNTSTHKLQVWVTSDLWFPVFGEVQYDWMDWRGNPLQSNVNTDLLGNISSSESFVVGPLNSTRVLEWHDIQSRVDASSAVLRLSVTGDSAGQSYKHVAWFHASSLADAELIDPGLRLLHNGGGSFTVKATQAVAAWVWLEYSTNAVTGYWSENGFWLNKGESKTVVLIVWEDWSGGSWVDAVNVRSIWDNMAD